MIDFSGIHLHQCTQQRISHGTLSANPMKPTLCVCVDKRVLGLGVPWMTLGEAISLSLIHLAKML